MTISGLLYAYGYSKLKLDLYMEKPKLDPNLNPYLCISLPKSHIFMFHRTYENFAGRFLMQGCHHFSREKYGRVIRSQKYSGLYRKEYKL